MNQGERPARPTQEIRLQPEAQVLVETAYKSIIGDKLPIANEFRENAALIMFLAQQLGVIQSEDLEKFRKEMEKYLNSHEVKDHKFSKIVQSEYEKLEELSPTIK